MVSKAKAKGGVVKVNRSSRPYLAELLVEHDEKRRGLKNPVITSYTLQTLKDDLRKLNTTRKATKKALRERNKIYENEAEPVAVGRSRKHAKKQRDDIDKQMRQWEDREFRDAQARLEDFLYYQDTIRRRKRSRAVDPTERMKAEAERLNRKAAYMLDLGGDDLGHNDWLHSVLETYDSRDIGGQAYKNGYEDSIGNPIPAPNRTYPRIVGPSDLHLWTPVYRRGTTGLRRFNLNDGLETRPKWKYIVGPGEDMSPLEFALDLPAIEAARKEHDERPKRKESDQSVAPNHSVRRAEQAAAYDGTRPNTCGFHVGGETAGGGIIQDRWREMQATQGDCLDKIGRYDIPVVAPTSAVRDEAFVMPSTKTLNDTSWMEETEGRREWHAYRQLSPSSDVLSPPRTPIQERIVAENSLPPRDDNGEAAESNTDSMGMWKVSRDTSSMFALEANKRRCATENCRAWWEHTASREECWVAYSTMARGFEEAVIRPVDAPLQMAESGRRAYQERVEDHYGMRRQPNSEARWPKLGIRVPYTSMSFDENDKVGEAYEFQTMTVPVIDKPVEGWGEVDPVIAPGQPDSDSQDDGGEDGEDDNDDDNAAANDRDNDDKDDDGDDGDDEPVDAGDLFYWSYVKGSAAR